MTNTIYDTIKKHFPEADVEQIGECSLEMLKVLETMMSEMYVEWTSNQSK